MAFIIVLLWQIIIMRAKEAQQILDKISAFICFSWRRLEFDMIEVLSEKCIGCGACLRACAYDAIKLENKLAILDIDKCTLCGACVQACAFDAIIIRKKEQAALDKSRYKGVWVFAEQHRGVIAPVVYELLGKGRDLADRVFAVLWPGLAGPDTPAQADRVSE